MKTHGLLIAFLALANAASAVDTTAPTLNITHTWVEKADTVSRFKILLAPRDETDLNPNIYPPPGSPPTTPPLPENAIWFRRHLKSTSPVAANSPCEWMPWTRGQPFDIGFTCTACVIEIRVRDVAAAQRRLFRSHPFSEALTGQVAKPKHQSP